MEIRKNGKVIKLTESDLVRITRKVLSERALNEGGELFVSNYVEKDLQTDEIDHGMEIGCVQEGSKVTLTRRIDGKLKHTLVTDDSKFSC